MNIESYSDLIQAAAMQDEPQRRAHLKALQQRLREGVQAAKLPWTLMPSGTAIQPLVIGSNEDALAVMAQPQNAPRALKLGWHSADIMWRLAGDTATDYNHYTKRAILAGIYSATLAVFVNDDSEGKADTYAFLDRRIDGVMKFEKAKAQFLRPDAERFSVTRFLGRLRYPAR